MLLTTTAFNKQQLSINERLIIEIYESKCVRSQMKETLEPENS